MDQGATLHALNSVEQRLQWTQLNELSFSIS